ncbi:MAG: prepilin-type N-terminal cleavage/methylation domain-containing protein [Phycisphaera sp.]|nr:prepilin-type N-terminal cleavage/methylation domain-containing protein [Phycisphaera sp.]
MPQARRPAFTVIELMVTITIIVILLAILVPLLGSSRKAARVAACVSNVGNIGQGMAMYVKDNRDIFPLGWSNASEWNCVGIKGSPLQRYLGSESNVAHCPLDVGSSEIPANQVFNDTTSLNTFRSSYRFLATPASGTINAVVGVYPVSGRRFSEFSYPSKKVVISGSPFTTGTGGDSDKRNQWHNAITPIVAGVAFADGSGRETAKESTSTSSNLNTLSRLVYY